MSCAPPGRVRSSRLANAFAIVQSASDDGVWDGTGVTSSKARADANNNGYTAIGVADNSDLGYSSFVGQDVSGNSGQQILFMDTYYGDGSLSGTVDNPDLLLFQAGKDQQSRRARRHRLGVRRVRLRRLRSKAATPTCCCSRTAAPVTP